MFLPDKLTESADTIDAALYLGDTFYDEFHRNVLKCLLERWQRRIAEIEGEIR